MKKIGSIKKNRILYIIIIFSVIVAICNFWYSNFSSLENNLKYKFPSSTTQIHYIDEENKIVLFSLGIQSPKQYVACDYTNFSDYYYKINDNGGIIVNSLLFITYAPIDRDTEMIWGVINTELNVSNVEIEIYNEDTNKHKKFTPDIYNSEVFVYIWEQTVPSIDFEQNCYFNMKGYNENGELILEESGLVVKNII